MASSDQPTGSISWADLTVPDAEKVRDFYQAVAGWTAMPVSMGEYEDFCMQVPGTENVVAGICHRRGANADLPAHWLVYITVDDIDQSLAQCEALGGKVLHRRNDPSGGGAMAVIEDPAGAVAALFQPAE